MCISVVQLRRFASYKLKDFLKLFCHSRLGRVFVKILLMYFAVVITFIYLIRLNHVIIIFLLIKEISMLYLAIKKCHCFQFVII